MAYRIPGAGALALAAVTLAAGWWVGATQAPAVASGSGSGSGAEWESGSESESIPVAAAKRSESAADPGSGRGSESVSDPGSALDSDPGSDSHSGSDSDPHSDPAQVAADEHAEAEAIRFELAGLLASQGVDREFRDRAEADIGQAAGQLSATGASLLSTDCRSTMCRVEVGGRSRDAIYAFMDRFPSLLPWNTELRATLADQPDGVVATVFLTRDGSPFPTLASES